MKRGKKIKYIALLVILSSFMIIIQSSQVQTTTMTEYCYSPPLISQNVPPIVMLVVGRDHKLYYEAYNDASDLDGDGKLDIGYKHSIDYYGYFDPYKCYKYTSTGTARFEPVRTTSNKYCGGADEWSGNFLNWLTMARIDVMRKALYGGYRSTDSSSETVLEATYIPQDAHSWGKEHDGIDTRLLTPFNQPTSGKRHLFCITSTSEGGVRKIRVLQNSDKRKWDWASKERPVCDNSLGTPIEYQIRVKVCDPSVGLESNCYRYPQGIYKPIGLLQKYSGGDGSKWCSKSLKSCQTDADCNPIQDGLCVDKSQMYFGLITGSYVNNLEGGVLRKNIWGFSDEWNPNTGFFQTSESVRGNIVLTLDRIRTVGFRYSDYSYQGNDGGTCGWITERPLSNSECRNWGNPLSEMIYEALRYFAGRTSPTSSFNYSGNQDAGLNLPKPAWGIKRGTTTYTINDIFPSCSKRFIIAISDINPSYDSNTLPGSYFGSAGDNLGGMNVSTLSDYISSQEGISGSWFIGQSGGLYDFICSPKNITGFSTIRGLCPEEPTKQGSYYSSSVAYYGNKYMKQNTNSKENVQTFAVALASPLPDIKIPFGNGEVRIVPMAKSVSGCFQTYDACAQKCTLTYSNGRLHISNCQSGSYCPTNTIVDYYIENVQYDSNNNITRIVYAINFEDVEQGADHDMDAIVRYTIEKVGTNQLKISLSSAYAAGCIDQVLGFFISGTTEDGTWLVVKDKDVAGPDRDTPSSVANMPLTFTKTFTVSGSASGLLKDPLWYMAKWGNYPNWDKDGDGVPDNYFLVTNPAKMEQELEKAFLEILRRASSGATVATLSSRTGISSVVIQPYFYPKYQTELGELSWLGFLRSFWVDLKQNLREDTIEPKFLDILKNAQGKLDQIIQFITQGDETKIAVLADDTDTGQNACTLDTIKDLNQIIPLFDSACQLAQINASDRDIKFNNSGSLDIFDTNKASTLLPIWRTVDTNLTESQAKCIIRYLRGENVVSDSNCSSLSYVQRPRELNIQNFCGDNTICTWKLGDIISSTPSVVSNQPANIYHLKYNDTSYLEFIRSDAYKNRPTLTFVGANDGMLHAFRVGIAIELANSAQPVKLQNAPNDSGTDRIGKEEWTFIPRNALPYLIWYGHPDYCHVPTVDYRTMVFDAKINGQWRTLLVGSMGFGGMEIPKVNPQFSSSVFVLDITEPLNPSLLWESSLPDKTLTLSFPALVVRTDADKNWTGAYVVVGTSPKNPQGTDFTTPKLYFFELTNGNLVKTLQLTGYASAAVGDIMPVDVDFDYSDDAIYFGVYTQNSGDFYRISLRSGSGYKSISALTDSDISKAVSISAPVFAAPTFTKDEFGKLWVFFGTGRYLTDSDKTIGYTNYLVGFKDPCWNGSCSTTYTKNNLTNTTNSTVQATVTEIKKICSCDASGCGLVDVVYDTTSAASMTEPERGWYYELTNEAIISQPIIFGGNLDALSLAIPQDICEYGGSTNLIALYYKSGVPNPRPAVFSSQAVQGTIAIGQTVTVKSKIYLGKGTPPLGNPFQITTASSREYKKFIQISTGVVLEARQQVSPGYEARFISWIEK